MAGRDGRSMAGIQGTHAGLLVVRIWREQMSEDPLRIHARVRSTVDVGLAADRTLVVGSANEVRQAVHEWLREYLVHYPRHFSESAAGTHSGRSDTSERKGLEQSIDDTKG
jgi:hypothetical protein